MLPDLSIKYTNSIRLHFKLIPEKTEMCRMKTNQIHEPGTGCRYVMHQRKWIQRVL